uniref:PPM-type phosphatase domain-containing protein n=1 Tax=Xiphophorus couchianus TaxID=32473 RepID=A0A3B5MJV9_9TELE
MISKVKNAMSNLVGGMMPHGHHHHNHHSGGGQNSGQEGLPHRFPYGRPDFLDLTPELLQYSTEHASRPVVTLKRGTRLPWGAGYAEAINAGKSMLNEDQASCEKLFVRKPSSKHRNSTLVDDNGDNTGIPLHFWGVFDGHAGSGAAIMASKLLHRIIRDGLGEICHLLENPNSAPPICLAKNGSPFQTEAKKGGTQDSAEDADAVCDASVRFHMEKVVSLESLVMGVIETAFKQMDDLIEKEKSSYAISGGCCALAVVYLMGKLYVANAGDSSFSSFGFLRPELLGNEFTHIEFPRRIQACSLLIILYNWIFWERKLILEPKPCNTLLFDVILAVPVCIHACVQARVMATIGVTRGLGDHDLKVYNSNIYIKPFLSCVPEVKVYNLDENKHGPDDILVMGTDGLWDVTTDKEVAEAVSTYLSRCDPSDPMRYTLAAQELLMRSRGVLKERGWRLPNEKLGSGDDITVFIIPLAGHESET